MDEKNKEHGYKKRKHDEEDASPTHLAKYKKLCMKNHRESCSSVTKSNVNFTVPKMQEDLKNPLIILSSDSEEEFVNKVVSKNVRRTTDGKSEKSVGNSMNKDLKKTSHKAFDLGSSDYRAMSKSNSLKIMNSKVDSNNRTNNNTKENYKFKNFDAKKVLKRINKIMNPELTSNDKSTSNAKKNYDFKNISVEKVLKRINKLINSQLTSDDESNLQAMENHDIKIFSAEEETPKVTEQNISMSIKISCHNINLNISEKSKDDNISKVKVKKIEIINKAYIDITKIQTKSKRKIEPCIVHEKESTNDKMNPKVENIKTSNQVKTLNAKLDVENHTCTQITDKSDCLLKRHISNSDTLSRDQLNEDGLRKTICNNENIDKCENIEQEKSTLKNNNVDNIVDSNSSDVDIDVENISDDYNCFLESFINQNRVEEKDNNSLLKNDGTNDLNLATSLKNNSDLSQSNENILDEKLDNMSDIDIENDFDKLNFIPLSNSTQVENNSFLSQNRCSIDNNSFEKKLNNASSKSQTKNNILTKVVSKNTNAKEKNNTLSTYQVICSKVNVEQKKTGFDIEFPQFKHSSLVTNSNGQKVFRFFWLDAYEDSYTDPGVLFLFGKVFEQTTNQQISCCVTVKNIPRRIYLLPRKNEAGEQSALRDARKELNEYMRKKNINKFKCDSVQKSYAFEKKDVPQSTTYLEVRYSASYPAFDSNYSSSAIQAVFGTNVTAMELFLIEKNINGPCWMDVKVWPHNTNLNSWCKIEINCGGMEDIYITQHQQKDLGIIPITVAALSIQVSLDEKLDKYDIASIGISVQENLYLDKETPTPLFNHSYCLIAQCSSWPKFANQVFAKKKHPKVVLCDTEVDLLEHLLQLLQSLDPDILIGYDTEFEFDILVRKILSLGVKDWSRIGKLRRIVPPKFKEKIYLNQVLCGRPLCDIQTSMNEFQLRMMRCDLASLYLSAFNKEIVDYKEIKPEECLQYYSSVYKMTILVESTVTKVSSIFEISAELNILSLAIQITKIVGNTLSRTLSCGVGERNEFLLLHVFQSKNYLTPDKRKDKSDMYDGNKKSTYTGGVILEPKAGFYDTLVLLLDFNSLYPSIIQEFNICFTTIPGAAHANIEDLSRVESCVEQGILPTEINRLVQSRLQIKKMMNSPKLSPDLRRQYNSRQLALKLTANSMYGCLGASYSRFYAQGLAALIAMRGREIFQKTKALIQSHNYEVIYGDTDSFMINVKLTDYKQVMTVGRELQKEINKLFKKIKIDIDRVFKCLLLIKKKQYAGLTITKLPNGELEYKKEIKGLEIIRRDCCAIASDIGNKVLEELLNDQSPELRLKNIFEILETISNELRQGKIPLSALEITKMLSKNPDKYTNKNYPHVIVAERLNKINARQCKAGDIISYIICEDNTARKPLERAYHDKEFKTNSHIKIDVNYYLLYQVFPIILKICDPIEGLEGALIAQSLGLADVYKPKKVNEDQEGRVPLSLRDDRYKNCMPLKFKCRDCKTENEMKTSIIYTKNGFRPSLAMCCNSNCNTPPWKHPYLIQNQIQMIVRKGVSKYYSGEIECSNPLCNNNKKGINLDSSDFIKCYDCFDGKRFRTYSEGDLHNQFMFFVNLFTLDPAACHNFDLFTSQEIINVYTRLKEFMLDQIDCNAYAIVDLNTLFPSNTDMRKNDDLESDLS